MGLREVIASAREALSAAAVRQALRPAPVGPAVPVVPVSHLARYQEPVRYSYDDGSKFVGGFGATELLQTDYWTLRARSSHLFESNLFARGIIRRLVTNEINTGLHLEATPIESILGYEADGLADWTEAIEDRFELWGRAPRLCDHRERRTFGGLQADARAEALIAGDVLVVLQQDPLTGLPRVRLVGGGNVQTPLGYTPARGHEIKHGVELDAQGRHVAFHVVQRGGESKRLPAAGKSGRRIAWLMYGADKRLDQVRGKPILSLVLQSLREIDRYRDSVQRKAVINSMLALFIKKTEPNLGSRPITGGAVRRTTVTEGEGDTVRRYNTAELIPGTVLDELQHGEEPVPFSSHGQDEQLGTFEEAIIQAIAWANEIPPEILRLAFSNNYSASQAAINEFKIYLNKIRTEWGDGLCHPIYLEWLLSEALSGRIAAPGLLEAWRDPRRYDVFAAWGSADWSGQIKPSTDIFKQARGYKLAIDEGLITRDRASRELSGTKYSQNVKKLRRENEALQAAREPLAATDSNTEPARGPTDAVDDDAEDPDEENEAA